jgi:ABC-type cobalamin/Fe3+-siderophores transport system ATPase subunit
MSSSEKLGITLSWHDLCAEIKGKTLLSNCSGYCKPGEMLAIMGASGAGKTTMLSVLSRKADPNLRLTGQVLANNTPFSSSSFYNFGVYVYQDDTLYENLTVRCTVSPMQRHSTSPLCSSTVAARKSSDGLISLSVPSSCRSARRHLWGVRRSGGFQGDRRSACASRWR